jgi:glyoxylase-like metal-dependent hydrolase (beta-lactamase superfamily II)
MHNVANAWPAHFSAELKGRQTEFAEQTKKDQQATGSAPTFEQRRQMEDDLQNYQNFVDEALTLHRNYPTLTYLDKLTLIHGGREFRFMSVTGDAEGTTVLYLPKEKILITGDAVSYPIPYVTPPPTRQARSLRALSELEVDTIIPGHGPAFHDKDYLNLEVASLESVTHGVREALQKGMLTLDEVQKAVTADELREKFARGDSDLESRFHQRVRDLVEIAIREQRDGQPYH